MTNYATGRINSYFSRGELAPNTTEKGKALEDLICYVFSKIPGISITRRNQLNAFLTEEVDVAFWNEKPTKGLPFMPNIILVECKNWRNPVGSAEVAWFIQKLRNRGRDYGILVASNGITGCPTEITDSHMQISNALQNGIYVIVLTRRELESLNNTDELIKLIKEKLCELAVSGTALYDTL